jgi:hypothetical protein
MLHPASTYNPLGQVSVTMSVRIANSSYSSNVIPLRRNTTLDDELFVDESFPEPARLYGLTVLAFLLHTPTRSRCRCVRCGVPWPCEHLRLAYRLREGF